MHTKLFPARIFAHAYSSFWKLFSLIFLWLASFLHGLSLNPTFGSLYPKYTSQRGEKGTPLPCWWEWKLVQPLWRTVWRFLKKLKIELPYDPAIPLLGIYPEKTPIWKDTCTPMFIGALFTIVKTWKQLKCLLTDAWIKKMWCIYTMEHYSAIKNNEIMPFAATWMDLAIIILTYVSQKEKDKYHIISLICGT